jgi:hypothetical protein
MLELTTKVIEEIIKLSEALETLTLKKIGALGIQLQSGQALDDIRNAVQLGKSTHDVFDDMGGFLSLK